MATPRSLSPRVPINVSKPSGGTSSGSRTEIPCYDEIRAAIQEAKSVTDKPTLIKVTTTIGFGSPNKANSYSVHGAALGAKEVAATRENLGWPHEPFHVPEDVKK